MHWRITVIYKTTKIIFTFLCLLTRSNGIAKSWVYSPPFRTQFGQTNITHTSGHGSKAVGLEVSVLPCFQDPMQGQTDFTNMC